VIAWDKDRRIYIQDLGATLGADTLRVHEALTGTKQGVDWLLENWTGLKDALTANGEAGWTPDQFRVAYELMGVRPEFRGSNLKLPAGCSRQRQAELVESEMKTLNAQLQNCLLAQDAAAQDMAAAGMPMEEDPQTKRLRKYEAASRLEYTRTKAELLQSRAEAAQAASATATATATGTGTAAASTATTRTTTAAAAATATAAPRSSGAVPTRQANGSSGSRQDKAPTPRPVPSQAACEFLVKQSKMWTEDLIPRHESAIGAEAPADPHQAPSTPNRAAADAAGTTGDAEDDRDAKAEAGDNGDQPLLAAESLPIGEQPNDRTMPAPGGDSQSWSAAQRERQERRRRRAQEKEARKAARRRRR
jgi:hypothetical protein